MSLFKLAALFGAGALGAAAYSFAHGGDATKVHACTTGEEQPILLSSPNGTCATGTPLDWATQGPAGPAGQRGPQGERGQTGPAGAAGKPGLTRLSAVKKSKKGPAGGGTVGVTATCPNSALAVSGGFKVMGDDEHQRVVRSSVVLAGSRPRGWSVLSLGGRRQTGWMVEVSVICAAVED